MSNKIQLTGAELSALKPLELPEHEMVQSKFINLYNSIHGTNQGELIYHKETFNFKRMIAEKRELQECSSLSLYGVFLDVAVNGLSLDSGSKPLAYVIPRNANIGTKDNPRYEKRAYLVVSPYGELVMRMRAGQIKHVDNPVVVFEGDTFEPYIDDNGQKKIRFSAVIPRKSKKIIGCFIRITRLDGSVDFEHLTNEDIDRLAHYSEKQNYGKKNPLYTSNEGQIDVGFLAGKMIKHAFRTYPKVRTRGVQTITEEVIEKEQIDYGVDMGTQPTDFETKQLSEAEDIETTNVTTVDPVPTKNDETF